jgi:EpsI family protein
MTPENSSDRSKRRAPSDSAGPAEGKPAPAWLLVMGAALGLVAFRDLLTFESAQSASRELEDWFFAASDTAPLVVLAFSAWLLYRRWDRLVTLPDREALASGPGSGLLAGVLLAAGAGVLGWATLTGATDLVAVALLLEGAGLAVLWKGLPALRVVWLPGIMLLFAVPIPAALSNVVIYAFQLWTGQWAGWLLYLIGSPAFVSGDLLSRPHTTFSIIEGCSGMRSVETLTMLSILLVDLLGRRGFHALALIVIAPLMAFAMNGFRVLTLIFNPHSEIVAIHNLQGVAVLLCGLAGMILVDTLIERATGPVAHRQRDGGGPATRLIERVQSRASARFATIGVAALLACAVVSLSVPQYSPRGRSGLGLPLLLADGIGDWRGRPLRIDRAFLGDVQFGQELHARFRRGSESVDLFLGVGSRALRGKTFMSPKTGLPGSGWTRLDRGKLEIPGAITPGEWQLLRANARRVLVYHWYVGTAGLLDEALREMLALDSSPFQRARDGIAVRMSTSLRGPGLTGLEAARARLEGFRGELVNELEPLRTVGRAESISPSSPSGKSFSAVLVLGHLRIAVKTGT